MPFFVHTAFIYHQSNPQEYESIFANESTVIGRCEYSIKPIPIYSLVDLGGGGRHSAGDVECLFSPICIYIHH